MTNIKIPAVDEDTIDTSDRDEKCLHCTLAVAIKDFIKKNGPMDRYEIAMRLGEVMSEFLTDLTEEQVNNVMGEFLSSVADRLEMAADEAEDDGISEAPPSNAKH